MNTIIEKQQYLHFHGAPSRGNILMVASSPTRSEQTEWPIGSWAAELTHPQYEFQQAGYEIELASTNGGQLEMDAYSNPAYCLPLRRLLLLMWQKDSAIPVEKS